MAEEEVQPAADAGEDEPVLDGEIVEEQTSAPDEDTTAEIADLKDRLARARADYQNLQKRVERDAALERERVKARVLEGFLQVYEYGKMAEFEADRNPGPLATGVKMVIQEFDRLLEKEGVKPVGMIGETFDLACHEAIGKEPGEGVEPGHVSRVVAPGYKLGERVLRHARVMVQPDEE